MNKQKTGWTITLIVFAALIIWLIAAPAKAGKLDSFADCLKQNGVKFYGAFWCPHCQAQKALFGRSVSHLPYIECSNPDGQSQNATCTNVGIQGYPTWVFPAGTTTSTSTGEQTLETLSQKSMCPLPTS